MHPTNYPNPKIYNKDCNLLIPSTPIIMCKAITMCITYLSPIIVYFIKPIKVQSVVEIIGIIKVLMNLSIVIIEVLLPIGKRYLNRMII
jgi:hypothetical protein